MNYYASPTGLSTNDGTFASPWDLQTALDNQDMVAGDILYLRGGTYLGKFNSTLQGGAVMSYCFALPGGYLANQSEWAKIDGNYSTTLDGAINSSQTTFNLASTHNIMEGNTFDIWIDQEVIHTYNKSGNTITGSIRDWGGSVGGAAAHANGATVRIVGDQLNVGESSNVDYFGFEVTSSSPYRTEVYQQIRGQAITNYTGNGNSFINLILHDCTLGFFTGSSSSNTLMYGNIVYNNGMRSMHPYGDNPRGGNFYLENAAGFSRVYENIVLNGATFNGQMFGVSGPYVGGDVQGSVFANSGGMVEDIRPLGYSNCYIGTGSQKIPYANVNESHFYAPITVLNSDLTMGYGAGMTDGDVTNCYIVGSRDGCEFLPDTGSFRGNICADAQGTGLKIPSLVADCDDNAYYNNPAFYYGPSGHSSVLFAQWKIDSGYDANSTMSTGDMPDTVVVRPNAHDIGRAHIIVYAKSDPASINVDLATTGLVHNQEYEIRNAFDFFGTEVATGVYDENDTVISLPLDGAARNVATPTGTSYTPATTLPNFGAFVVLPGIADVAAPGNPSNLQVNTTVRRGATGTMVITWDLADGTDTSVVLTRVLNGTPTEIVLESGTESYTNTGLTIGATYTFYVRAVNASGASENTAPIIRTLTGLSSFGAPPSIG